MGDSRLVATGDARGPGKTGVLPAGLTPLPRATADVATKSTRQYDVALAEEAAGLGVRDVVAKVDRAILCCMAVLNVLLWNYTGGPVEK